MGYPLTAKEYGGAWIYGITDTLVSVGYVTGLDYEDPRTDPHHVFQSFKQHPFARRHSGGRQDGSLWRKVASLWRMAHDAASLRAMAG